MATTDVTLQDASGRLERKAILYVRQSSAWQGRSLFLIAFFRASWSRSVCPA